LREIVRPRRFTGQGTLRLASHLTERDRQIAVDCFEHHVLTTSQIKRLHFTDTRTATARLNVLYRLRVLDRFRPSLPRGQGTAPYHWILDEAGALIAAGERDVERSKLGWQHAVAVNVATSPKLAHHIEVNEFVVRLAIEAKEAGGHLLEWYGERTLHGFFNGRLIPDSYAVLRLHDCRLLHVLVELDRGTETLERLRLKAMRYERELRYKPWREVDPIALFVVPSQRRAQTVTDAIADLGPSLAVIVWSSASIYPPLTGVLNVETRRRHASTGLREGLRRSATSDLLDYPQAPEQEPIA
jgi:hypothetical protein